MGAIKAKPFSKSIRVRTKNESYPKKRRIPNNTNERFILIAPIFNDNFLFERTERYEKG